MLLIYYTRHTKSLRINKLKLLGTNYLEGKSLRLIALESIKFLRPVSFTTLVTSANILVTSANVLVTSANRLVTSANRLGIYIHIYSVYNFFQLKCLFIKTQLLNRSLKPNWSSNYYLLLNEHSTECPWIIQHSGRRKGVPWAHSGRYTRWFGGCAWARIWSVSPGSVPPCKTSLMGQTQ